MSRLFNLQGKNHFRIKREFDLSELIKAGMSRPEADKRIFAEVFSQVTHFVMQIIPLKFEKDDKNDMLVRMQGGGYVFTERDFWNLVHEMCEMDDHDRKLLDEEAQKELE